MLTVNRIVYTGFCPVMPYFEGGMLFGFGPQMAEASVHVLDASTVDLHVAAGISERFQLRVDRELKKLAAGREIKIVEQPTVAH